MINTFNPSAVHLSISGHKVHGITEIAVKKNSQTFEIIKGIRGKNTRKRNKDSSCIVSISLIQTSTSNDVLSEILALDKELGTGQLSLQLKDISGSTLIKSDNAFIEDYPEATFQDTIQTRTWNICCLSTSEYVIGGNVSPPSLLDSITSLL